MTELNQKNEPEAAQPTPDWPAATADGIDDPSVAAIVTALDGVQALPVAEHETVYSELHDALLQALNEDAPLGEGRS
ncbi:hypothetical protein [Arthrobacter sp. HMWF013]|uniref:hypothetical protein n=1 Tax=Arthrobacter sp. HMWF013 TaxID=2056849 RepID=UPI000D37EC11|nr:hypothetical protein [Arthrobacter sp. HMWF013]PTT70357.1 hypothetical protein DBR22_01415 [Arthrobacter sp. HMWF013]